MHACRSTLEDPTAYFAKLDADGVALQARSFGENAGAKSLGITNDGRVVIAGPFKGTMDFGDGKTLYNGSGSTDTFIASFEYEGTIRWVKKLWGRALADVANVAYDGDGSVVIAGVVGVIPGDTTSTWNIGSYDFNVPPNSSFAARFAPNTGSTRWAKVYTATGSSQASVRINTMAVTPNKRILLGGYSEGTTDFGRDKTVTSTAFLARIYP